MSQDSKRNLKEARELASRLNWLYRAFNQAYGVAPEESREIDTRMCREVIEETRGLAEDPLTAKPETVALLSYMLLESSRFPAMLGASAKGRALKNQDRKLWDKALIEKGLEYLNSSAEGNSVSVYHLKAAVSACHSLTKDYWSTDWKHILSLYDSYLEFNNSTEIALERARVISRTRGPRAEIKAIEEIIRNDASVTEHVLYEKLGGLYSRLHDYKKALNCFEHAYRNTQSKTDKAVYKKKIEYCKMRIYYKKKYALGLSF